jgi:hypothetical protein
MAVPAAPGANIHSARSEPADYPAGFRFTNDLKWLVRMQKTGSGESTLYLYRLDPQGFVPATKKPLGDLAWAYFKSRSEWRKVKKTPSITFRRIC